MSDGQSRGGADEFSALDAVAVSALIEGVYDCVFDERAWGSALQAICSALGGCAASLNVHTVPEQVPELVVEHGTDPDFSRSYIEVYGRINPLFSDVALNMSEGEIVTLYKVVEPRQYQRTRFYREWVRPQGWGDWIGGLLIRSPSRLSLFTAARLERDGPFSSQQIALSHLLMPHIQRATVLGRLLDERTHQRDGLAASLDNIRVAAFLLDPDGSIAHANVQAETLLSEGELARLMEGRRLRLGDPNAQKLLGDVLTRRRDIPGVVTIDATQGKRVLSIVPASRESGGQAIVLITVPEPSAPLVGPLLARAFGLTPAELRVLVLLMSGSTAEDIRGELGITQRTVKAHLQKLFAKTATSRQSDLLLTVMKAIPPFT